MHARLVAYAMIDVSTRKNHRSVEPYYPNHAAKPVAA